jgi:hypothetical protein
VGLASLSGEAVHLATSTLRMRRGEGRFGRDGNKDCAKRQSSQEWKLLYIRRRPTQTAKKPRVRRVAAFTGIYTVEAKPSTEHCALSTTGGNKLSARLTRGRHGTREVTSEEPRRTDGRGSERDSRNGWRTIVRAVGLCRFYVQLQWPGPSRRAGCTCAPHKGERHSELPV